MAREEGIRVCMRVSIYLDERALPADDDIRTQENLVFIGLPF